MGELRDPVAVRWDFDRAFRLAGLEKPFPRGISFADVDFEIEIGGHFLVIEGKRDGQDLSKGQSYAMAARARDGRTCLTVWGEPPLAIHSMQLWGGPVWPVTLADFGRFCAKWARWADGEPRPAERPNAFREGLWAQT